MAKPRRKYFTFEESILLVDSVEKHPLVNSKKTDAATNTQKVREISGPVTSR